MARQYTITTIFLLTFSIGFVCPLLPCEFCQMNYLCRLWYAPYEQHSRHGQVYACYLEHGCTHPLCLKYFSFMFGKKCLIPKMAALWWFCIFCPLSHINCLVQYMFVLPSVTTSFSLLHLLRPIRWACLHQNIIFTSIQKSLQMSFFLCFIF
jgi:hypothetical protein